VFVGIAGPAMEAREMTTYQSKEEIDALINLGEFAAETYFYAEEANEEIARLQGIIKAMAGTIFELQEAIFILKGKRNEL
jgi:hypothetical protein